MSEWVSPAVRTSEIPATSSHWAEDGDVMISVEALIGTGGYGEVYKVRFVARTILTVDAVSGNWFGITNSFGSVT
jgi:hypothetical protein